MVVKTRFLVASYFKEGFGRCRYTHVLLSEARLYSYACLSNPELSQDRKAHEESSKMWMTSFWNLKFDVNVVI